MSNIDRVLANVSTLKARNAPESYIDSYVLHEGYRIPIRAPGVSWRKPLLRSPEIALSELNEKYGLLT